MLSLVAVLLCFLVSLRPLFSFKNQIDEPNTPYNYDSGAESDCSNTRSPKEARNALDFEQLQGKLVDVAANCPPSPASSHGDQSDDEGKKKAFAANRKKHYNEMELVKKFREEHANDEDEGNEADMDM
jgi:protein phosphatase inhibitor 2